MMSGPPTWQLIEIPRTGSTAVRGAIGQGCRAGVVRHLPASCYPDVDYLVSVVRDPFDRLVSAACYTCSSELMETPGYFRQWVADGMHYNGASFHDTPQTAETLITRNGAWILCPQVTWLNDRVDLLRFDRLKWHLRAWCRLHHLPRPRLQRVNESRHGPTGMYYDLETRQRVAQCYAEDIDLWNWRINSRGFSCVRYGSMYR